MSFNELIPNSEIIQTLEHNWNYYVNDKYLLMSVIETGREEIIMYLLKHPDINVNQMSDYSETALHKVCRSKNIPILKLLLGREDLDVNIRPIFDRTGLHYLCLYGSEAGVKEFLLDARIDTSIRDYEGLTSRDIALDWRYPSLAKIINNSRHTSLLRIPNETLPHDITQMIIEEYL